VDPISSKEYTYSLANNKREYQIQADFENPLSSLLNNLNPIQVVMELPLLTGEGWGEGKASATSTGSYNYITGNFN
jgi:hypothetical protein